jgi:putative transposase
MPRAPRLILAGQAHHIIQRGNNGQPIFATRADYEALLGLLDEHSRKSGVAIHAYVLMSNHFHLLATPDGADGVPRLMQSVGRRYVRYFNQTQGRTGTLWEGRYRSTLVQAERYLLACMVYIDLNPVRAGLADSPQDYAWSSYSHYVGRRFDRLVTPHPIYWELGNTPFDREAAYASLVAGGMDPAQEEIMTRSVMRGWALGEPDYIADLQRRTARRITKARAGRPSKQASTGES